jgi:hypothetical protein
MTGTTRAAGLVAVALAIGPLSAPGCAFAVEHPAVTTGIVGGTLGFGTCKLASDSYGACALVGGGAAAFLALVTAAALWLGGDGHSIMAEPQAQPLPDEPRPARTRKPPSSPPSDNPAAPPPSESPHVAPPPAPSGSPHQPVSAI